MKTCGKCKSSKTLDAFYNGSRFKDGKQSWCKACYRERGLRNLPAQLENLKAWGRANPERRRAAFRRYYHRHPDHSRPRQLAKYGLTVQEYDALFFLQDGRCLICKQPERGRKGRLAVDHDHGTGEVRGLLCASCNFGIAHFDDNPALLREAALYVGFQQEQ